MNRISVRAMERIAMVALVLGVVSGALVAARQDAPPRAVAAQRLELVDPGGIPVVTWSVDAARVVTAEPRGADGEPLVRIRVDPAAGLVLVLDPSGQRIARLTAADIAALATAPDWLRSHDRLIDHVRADAQTTRLRQDSIDDRLSNLERREQRPDAARRQDEVIRDLQQVIRRQDQDLRTLRDELGRLRRDLDRVEWRLRELPR
jgi:hypothetical protein